MPAVPLWGPRFLVPRTDADASRHMRRRMRGDSAMYTA